MNKNSKAYLNLEENSTDVNYLDWLGFPNTSDEIIKQVQPDENVAPICEPFKLMNNQTFEMIPEYEDISMKL